MEIVSNSPGERACFVPQPGIIAGRLDRQDMISMGIQPSIACQSQLHLIPTEAIIMPSQARQRILGHVNSFSGIGVNQSMSYLIAEIRANQESVVHQLAQADVRLPRRDLQGLGYNLGLERLHSQNPSQAQAGASLIAHLL